MAGLRAWSSHLTPPILQGVSATMATVEPEPWRNMAAGENLAMLTNGAGATPNGWLICVYSHHMASKWQQAPTSPQPTQFMKLSLNEPKINIDFAVI